MRRTDRHGRSRWHIIVATGGELRVGGGGEGGEGDGVGGENGLRATTRQDMDRRLWNDTIVLY